MSMCRAWLTLTLAAVMSMARAQTVAFYYGQEWLPELAAFDIAVVEPLHGFEPAQLRRPGFEPFAYVSVGEMRADHPAAAGLPAACRVGVNAAWGGVILDHSRELCRRYWIETVFTPLWSRGWRGFFLDTLDSYHLLSGGDTVAQEAGLVSLIEEIRRKHPEARLILNRGFELLPQVAPLVEAVAAESLFGRYDAASRSYGDVPEADRLWLLGRLEEVKSRYGLPVIVIDYAPPGERERARSIARRIAALGFMPWVTDGELTSLGLGTREAIPRTLLVLYDGHEAPSLDTLPAHRFLAMPAEYLGLRVRYVDMNGPLPEGHQAGRLAGVVVWGAGKLERPRALATFLDTCRRESVPVLLLNTLPFDPLRALGTKSATAAAGTGLTTQAPAFESPLPPRLVTGATGLAGPDLKPWVRAGEVVLAGLAPWGGFALAPALIDTVPGTDQLRWRVDPFRLLQEGLRLPAFPVPDVTTENGLRLMTIHIDGDGFVSRAELPGRPWAGAVLLDFIRKRPLPHSVSVIEGEIGPAGLYPKDSPALEAIARQIFALPWVEAASHSYSHPFKWAQAAEAASTGQGDYILPIPGYVFDARREIVGSRDYVAGLVPPNKRVRLFFWTGDCAPTAGQIRLAEEAGLLNINGGDSILGGESPGSWLTCSSLTCVSPMGIQKDGALQVYAPVANENLYTREWTGPFWGYRQVIETFEALEAPRRLKPVGIYYHFYSATKPASLKALEEVYAWAQRQPLYPVFVSEYVEKVRDFFDFAVAREGTRWLLRSRGALRTVRLDDGSRPDLTASVAVAGFNRHGSSTYVHLAGSEAWLAMGEGRTLPYLREVNARLTDFSRNDTDLRLVLDGHGPVRARLAAPAACQASADRGARISRRDETLTLESEHARLTITLRCPAP